MDLWIWNWIGGGYNSAKANSREEALAAANKIAAGTVLRIDEDSLHVGTYAERSELDRQYAGMFD